MKFPIKGNGDEEEPTTGESRRKKMVTLIEQNSTGSHPAAPQGDMVLASAIIELAKEAKNAVDATEKGNKRTTQVGIIVVLIVLLVSVISTADQRLMAHDVRQSLDHMESDISSSMVRQGEMGDVLDKVAKAVVNDIQADLEDDVAELDELLAEAAEEAKTTYRHNEAREILKKSKAARPKRLARAKKAVAIRIEAQSSAIAAQHAIADEPEEVEYHARKYKELQRAAKKARVELPELAKKIPLPDKKHD
jgi:hypothetical protein